MTADTKKLLQQLEEHANHFSGDRYCLTLIPIAPMIGGAPIYVFPEDVRKAIADIRLTAETVQTVIQ